MTCYFVLLTFNIWLHYNKLLTYLFTYLHLAPCNWGRPWPSELWPRDCLEKGHYSRRLATYCGHSNARAEYALNKRRIPISVLVLLLKFVQMSTVLYVHAVVCVSFAERQLAVVTVDRCRRRRHCQSRQRTFLSRWSCPTLFKVIMNWLRNKTCFTVYCCQTSVIILRTLISFKACWYYN